MQTKSFQNKIIYAWDNYRDIFLLYRKDGKKKVKKVLNFNWYFCISMSDHHKAEQTILRFKKTSLIKGVVLDKKLEIVKIYCDRSSEIFNAFISELKAFKVTCLEMDLSLVKRFMIDNHMELSEDLKIGYFDIETDDRVGMINVGAYPILSWAIVGDDDKVHYDSSANERELLLSFLKAMDEYDVIVGWNSSNFDIPYIKERMLRNGLELVRKDKIDVWRRTMHVDLMMRYVKLFAPIMSILNLSGFSLNEFSRVFLKRQKVELPTKIYKLFEDQPELLKEYNVNDCKLVKELNEHMQTLPLMIKECAWTGSFLDKFFVGELLDNYMLRESKKKGKYLLSRPNKDEEKRNRRMKIRGGYVKKPVRGFYDNVRVFDFKSLYPSIIIGHNIGGDTLKQDTAKETRDNLEIFLGDTKIEEVDFDKWVGFLMEQKVKYDPDDKYYQTAANQFFRKDEKSIVSELVANLLEQRKVYKEKLDTLEEGTMEFANARAMQEVVKELANSMFGVTADASSRYYSPYISESITLTGQFWNRLASVLFVKHFQLETLYSDTDSVFLQVQEDKMMDLYHKGINKHIQAEVKKLFHVEKPEEIIDLEYEKSYGKLILLDKKRYIGRMVWSNGKKVDFLHSRGTENVKKDTISLTKTVLVELVEKIIDGMTEKEAVVWTKALKERVRKDKFEAEDITIVKKVAKPLSEYKTMQHHHRLAVKLLKAGKITETKKAKVSWGARIRYIIVDQKDKPNGAIPAEDYKGEFDREYYWNVQVYSPLNRILKVVFPDMRWDVFKGMSSQLTLFESC